MSQRQGKDSSIRRSGKRGFCRETQISNMAHNRRTKNKSVAFDQVVIYIEKSPGQVLICTKDELKPLWYSREELVTSCTQVKDMVKVISAMKGEDLKSIDHSQVCVVGLEKQFHGKKDRDKYRKLLVRSVLIRQEMNRGLGLVNDTRSLCEISEMISASFKEFALWQAAMHQFHAHEIEESSSPLLLSSSSTTTTSNLESSPNTGQLSVSHSQQQQQQQQCPPAKRQKTSDSFSSDLEPGLGQADLAVIQNPQKMTKRDSELLLSEMQSFVEGYCSR